MYDTVLRLDMPTDTRIVGFADDIAIVTVAKDIQQAEENTNAAVFRILEWMEANSLSIAAHKTEAVLISSRKKVETARIEVAGCSITSKPAIKYLEVMMDHRLTFKAHLQYAANKAGKATSAITRLMANVGGPKQRSRWLISTVVRSIILYAGAIWAPAISSPTYSRNFMSSYRTCALRTVCAFRTVLEDAAFVLSDMAPLDLLANEARNRDPPPVRRETTLTNWQRIGRDSNHGSWTRRLLPDIRQWLNRKHGQTDFYLTQLLTGHGCFKSYLQ
ncbi:uncharacterized protein LOC124461774 [Drosophila willistoni]|uniref:uncharacterized protein LOC124461774 n=1 Tax=Drosophila willistoni TaxID=7260 RepID=UPI001F07F9FF|nr:uncharacterized protein LOC124461774 [Drosophila willistoni]